MRLSATVGSGGCGMSFAGCGEGCLLLLTLLWWCGRPARRELVQPAWPRLSGCSSIWQLDCGGKSVGGRQRRLLLMNNLIPTVRNRQAKRVVARMAERLPQLVRRLGVTADRLAVSALLGLVAVYRLLLSPLLGRHCRFEPTCSRYFADAVQKYGAVRGTIKGIGRICRCHPWQPGGHDPP